MLASSCFRDAHPISSCSWGLTSPVLFLATRLALPALPALCSFSVYVLVNSLLLQGCEARQVVSLPGSPPEGDHTSGR